MIKLKTVIWMVLFGLFLLIAGGVYAQALDIPYGDYEILSANDTQTEFVLAFTDDYRWHVRALCIQPDILPPSVGSLCSYNGEVFTCPGAQSLSLLEILQQPPTPTVPSATPTATATFTPTQTFTPTPTFTPMPSATTTPTATLTQTQRASQPATVVPSWTPVLPGAPASEELLATISAANQAFQSPEESATRSLLDWIKWLFQQFLLLFGK
jgi:hypothetical protein